MNPILVNVYDTFIQELESISESHRRLRKNLSLRVVLLAIIYYFVTIHHILKILVC